jgi:hypothetical protein
MMAEAQWYRTYDEGREAFQRGDLSAAEAKLLASVDEAVAAGVKPGRNVRTYGMRFINFVPDYYLGLVYARKAEQTQGQERLENLRRAEAAFSSVSAGKLLNERDREFANLQRQAASVRSALTETPSAPAPGVAGGSTVGPATGEVTAPAAPPAEAVASTGSVPAQVPILPEAGPITPIRPPPSYSQSIAAAGRDSPNRSSESSAGATTTKARPGTSKIPIAPSPTSPRAAPTATREPLQAALRTFFGGEYAEAARQLRSIADGGGASPRVNFYLACSYAALAVLRQDQNLAEEARAAWRVAANTGATFDEDRRFISPKILQLITGPTPTAVR